MSRRALAGYHRRAYQPEKIVLAAAGNVGHTALASLLDERRNGAAPGPGLAARKPARRREAAGAPLPAQGHGAVPRLSQWARDLARNDERRFAGSLMDAIVGGSASSRLFQEIREKRGMAYSVYSYSSQYEDAGQVGVYVGTREDNLAECLEIAVAELTDIAGGNVRADELARAKENLKGRILLSLESTSSRMTRLGKSTITDTPLLTPEQIVKRLEAVTAGEVAELADALLAPERLSVAGIGPDEARFADAAERVNPALAARAA